MFILAGECDSLGDVLVIIRSVVTVIQWIVPAILILMGTIDLVKAVTQGKEDDIKKGQKTLITRVIAAVIVFLVPLIVTVLMDFIGKGSNGFASCWRAAGNRSIQEVIDSNE